LLLKGFYFVLAFYYWCSHICFKLTENLLKQWFSVGRGQEELQFCFPGTLAMSLDIWEDVTDIYWVETGIAAKIPTMPRSAFHNKEFSGSKYQSVLRK
jgi:hypothetical protein